MNKIFLFLSCFFSFGLYAQLQDYHFQQSIADYSNEWHQIKLPSSIFEKINPNFSDIRIYGLTQTDTIEVPYIIKGSDEQKAIKEIEFKLINVSENKSAYYYTFELNQHQLINQIQLSFNNKNFNFSAKLEGSNNQNQWFTLLNNYQLIGVRNQFVDFNYSTLNFSQAKYKYYRLSIKSETKPQLRHSSILISEKQTPNLLEATVKTFGATQDMPNKKTNLLFNLSEKTPISSIHLKANDSIDYYRNYTLSYLTDSVQTEKGFIYNYRHIKSGVIHSFFNEPITFNSVIAQQFKIEVFNQDNQALNFSQVSAAGPTYQLITRFVLPAKYYLVYGNGKAGFPNYDISYYADKIPTNLKRLALGEIKEIEQSKVEKTAPLFENINWLFVMLSIIILGLGWFSIKMLRNMKQ